MITISLAEYERLLEAETWLGYLEAAGVDNTMAWDEAHQMRREEEAGNGE